MNILVSGICVDDCGDVYNSDSQCPFCGSWNTRYDRETLKCRDCKAEDYVISVMDIGKCEEFAKIERGYMPNKCNLPKDNELHARFCIDGEQYGAAVVLTNNETVNNDRVEFLFDAVLRTIQLQTKKERN